ncbi:hypothetical protein [Paracoccus xiamenensis]|uniref:hypothetical protein n=1 Tax=Paracoccus xiamenensis TaxID=2714901 RepID=UPI00140C3519|nr:hypothetical protein [Paracoccus xiamenensis]NHF71963.1 hypothetical protein [Paracoccus xiamenensis]
MSVQTTNTSAQFGTGLRNWFAGLMKRLGESMQQSMELRSRMDKMTALENKSDEELAKLGITRAQIPYYVFRDRMWL